MQHSDWGDSMAGVEENSRQLLQEVLLKTFTKYLNPKDHENYFYSLLGILVKGYISAPALLVSYSG